MSELKVYRGWLYFCPIFFYNDDNAVIPRHLLLKPIFELSLGMHNLFTMILSLFIDYEATFPIKITGEVEITD